MKAAISIIGFLSVVLLASAAWAQADANIGAAIQIDRFSTGLNIGPNEYDTTVTRVGVVFGERLSPALQLGIGGGYLSFSQSSNAALGGLAPSGHYGVFSVLYSPAIERNWGYVMGSKVIYEDAAASDASRSASLRWWSGSLRLGVWMRTGLIRMGAGLISRGISGHEYISRSQSRTFDLSYPHRVNPYAQILVLVKPSGHIGLTVQGGARRSLGLVFSYDFLP